MYKKYINTDKFVITIVYVIICSVCIVCINSFANEIIIINYYFSYNLYYSKYNNLY